MRCWPNNPEATPVVRVICSPANHRRRPHRIRVKRKLKRMNWQKRLADRDALLAE
jgi:hypothetical protein